MKRLCFFFQISLLVVFLLSMVGSRNCLASPIDGSGLSILLIDGDDSSTAVPFDITDYSNLENADLYYRLNSGSWNPITFSGSNPGTASVTDGDGGDTLDFLLDVDGDDLFSFSSSDATLTYSGEIDPVWAENPDLTDDGDPYYRTVQIFWSGLSSGSFQLEVVSSEDVHDGFAPVPIAQSALLLGSGVFGLLVLGFRRRTARE